MRERRRFIGIGGIWIAGLGLRSGRIEQLTYLRDVIGTLAAGEQAVVADAVEAGWQDMDEEAANELVGAERHHLGPFSPLGAIVLPLEGNPGMVEGDQATVGATRWV